MTDSSSSQQKSEHQDAPRHIWGLVLKRFLVYFVLLSAIALSMSVPVYVQYKDGVQKQLLANEEISVVSAVQMFQKEMYEQIHMLHFITQTQALKEYLSEGTAQQHRHVEELFAAVATTFHRFDQIRLLDNTGLEKIRINLVDGQSVAIKPERLQNKANRYYFQATQQMQLGQVYISSMDLNIENGVIEEPYKPTLRFSTPLKDAQGNQAGVLVINYLAKGMLVRFRQLMSQRIDQQGMLLDSKGYWLSNHERSNEWGADLGHPDHNFAQLFPKVWPVVAANKAGVFETKKGVFRYQSIEPLNFLDSQPAHFRMEHHALMTDESYTNTDWKLVVFLPRAVIDAHSLLNQPLGRIVLALIVALLAGLAFLVAYIGVQKQLRLQEEQQARALLKKQATIDALTGIRNRRSFYEAGETQLKRALRYKEPLAALMLDADYFKKVNDTYGHAVGDLVLKDLAATLQDTLREVDVLGRVGGEEFAVILLHMSAPEAAAVAERLRVKIAQRNITLPEGDSISFTVSIGVAIVDYSEKQLSDLIKKADAALYKAKKGGRNQVVQYTQSMSQ